MKKALPLLLFLLLIPLFTVAAAPPYREKRITLSFDEERAREVSLRIDVNHAMRAERAGGYLALYRRLCGKYSPKQALNYLAEGLGDYLSAECERRRTDPLDATLEWTHKGNTPFIYYEERIGKEVRLSELGESVARAMDTDTGAHAHARTHDVAPTVTRESLRSVTGRIASFSTDFSSSGESRRHNIALAASALSGIVLRPGESFSFNERVGERSEERGYRTANIVLNGEFVKGVGGGVCQVSTTLYNAVLLAGLPVQAAAAHSCPVSYVPYSRDCTVSSAIDFRFRNDGEHPLYITTEVKGSRLTFLLYGEKKKGERSLQSEITERIPFRDVYADGSAVPCPAAATLIRPGREGIRSRLYLIEIMDGVRSRTLIRENLYPAKDAIYA